MFVADEGVAARVVVWLACPAPPRAYPARGASLARAPFAVRKGRGGWWGFCGDACFGGLVGCPFVPGSPSP